MAFITGDKPAGRFRCRKVTVKLLSAILDPDRR